MALPSDESTADVPAPAGNGPVSRSAAASLEILMEGNRRFVAGRETQRDHLAIRSQLTSGQHPVAVVLRCADSRTAPEIIFDQGLGSLFVCGVAGQVVNTEIVASMEYAVTQLDTPLIVVMGHTGCGAVQAAIEHFDSDEGLPGSLPDLVSQIRPAVEEVRGHDGDQLSLAVEANARLVARRLLELSPVLQTRVDERELLIVSGVYDLTSGVFALIEA